MDDFNLKKYLAEGKLIKEEVVGWNWSKEQIISAAENIATAINKIHYGYDTNVHDFEYNEGRGSGFEISINDEPGEGGSYHVTSKGEVINAALTLKGGGSPIYANIGDDINTVINKIKNLESKIKNN